MVRATDGQFGDMLKTGDTEGIQGIHQLIELAIQLHNGRNAVTLRRERHQAGLVNFHRIGAQQQQIATRLDGEEA